MSRIWRGPAWASEQKKGDEPDPEHIFGAYVSKQEVKATLNQQGFNLPITIDAHLFFRG